MSSSNDENNPATKSVETEDTFDDNALEQGVVPPTSENKSSNGPVQRKTRLSVRSQKYDIDGDGKLDEIEKAMRDMDSKDLGHLSNEKVYKILQEQMRAQQELFNMKRVLFVLTGFTALLALSNLGTAFAAAWLAKDTQLNSNGVLVSKNEGGQVVGVKVESVIFELTPVDEERRLALENGDTASSESGSLSFADSKDLYDRCDGTQSAYMRRACGDEVFTFQVCGTGVSGEFSETSDKTGPPIHRVHTWTYLNGDVQVGPCTSDQGTCAVALDSTAFPCEPIVISGPVCMVIDPDNNPTVASTCTPCDPNGRACPAGEECAIPDGMRCPF